MNLHQTTHVGAKAPTYEDNPLSVGGFSPDRDLCQTTHVGAEAPTYKNSPP